MSVTIHDLRAWRARGERFAMATAYDATFARILDDAGIPILLVGDSLGMAVLGHPTTIPVTIDDVLHHARAVARGSRNALVVGDLPFGSYHASPEDGVRNSVDLLRAGVHAVKLEGAGRVADLAAHLVALGIPVMGHIGLTPQSVNALGGFKVQGRGDDGERLLAQARELADAGVFATVLECVPVDLAKEITRTVDVPTIGIGAGPHTDGQVLVSYDLLGMTQDPRPRFVKRYADLEADITRAAREFAKEVAEGVYPAPEHTYR